MFLPVKNREKKNEPSAPEAPPIDRCTGKDGRKSPLSEKDGRYGRVSYAADAAGGENP